jgi:malonyl CoA-acyl carrier protein transacylase
VLSGPRSALPAAEQSAKALGLRALILPVTGAFHSPMMQPAVADFERALGEIEIRPTVATVISAVTAQPFDDVRARLAQALTGPVRWREVMLELRASGVERFVEVGPGRVLTGLAKRTLKDVELVNA